MIVQPIEYGDNGKVAREKINAMLQEVEEHIPSIRDGKWYLWETDTGIDATWPQWPKGDDGEQGVDGEKGDKWDPFRYEDFTPEQLEWLKWPQWEQGEQWEQWEKGDAFKYEDFTPEQLEWLKWPQGEKGDDWEKGDKGDKWDKGDKGDKPVKWVDYFTQQDIESLNIPTKVSDLENDEWFITESDIPTKVSELENDTEFITNADVPTKLSELSNDEWFIKNTVDNLVNYYKKSELYTQAEIDELLGDIVWIKVEIVNALPQSWENWVIYFVPNSWSGQNVYDEYIWLESQTKFEKIWTTEIDLSNYYTKDETDDLLDEKADKTDVEGVIKFWDNEVDDMYTYITDANWNYIEFYSDSFYVENENGEAEGYDFFGDYRIARLNETMRWFPLPDQWDDVSEICRLLRRWQPVYFYERASNMRTNIRVVSYILEAWFIRSYMDIDWKYLDILINEEDTCDGVSMGDARLVYQTSYTWKFLPSNNEWEWNVFSYYKETNSSFTIKAKNLASYSMWFEYKLKVKNSGNNEITVSLWTNLLNPRNIPMNIAPWKEAIFIFYTPHSTARQLSLANRIDGSVWWSGWGDILFYPFPDEWDDVSDLIDALDEGKYVVLTLWEDDREFYAIYDYIQGSEFSIYIPWSKDVCTFILDWTEIFEINHNRDNSVPRSSLNWVALSSNNTMNQTNIWFFKTTSANFTLHATPDPNKRAIEKYCKIKNNWANDITITLWNNIDNPFNVDTTVKAGKEVVFIFHSNSNDVRWSIWEKIDWTNYWALIDALQWDVATLEDDIATLNDDVADLQNNKADKSELPDMSDYYDKTAVNGLLSNKADASDLNNKADKSNTYTKSEVDSKIDEIDLTDYYKKSETYSSSEVDTLIWSIVGVEFEVVQALPQEWENWVIYLISNGWSGTNVYDEYIWLSSQSKFEKIWTTEVDLTNYYTKTETDWLLNDKADKSNTYTKTETDWLLDDKADKSKLPSLTTQTQQTPWQPVTALIKDGDNEVRFDEAGNTIQMDITDENGTNTRFLSTKDYVDEKTGQATENTLGTVKLNPNKSITLNNNWQLEVGGRIGQFEGTTGLFAPDDREPRQVQDYSFLVTDAKGMSIGNRALAVVSGVGITVRSATPGTTVYYAENTYLNRIIAKTCENGFVSKDEATSKVEMTIPVVSVLINGQTFTPDSSPDDPNNPIVITLESSANPDTTITQLRMFGVMNSYATAHIGNGVHSEGWGRNLLVWGALSKYGSSNDNCMVWQQMYSSGNGNALFGRNHIAIKNRSLLAGTGHDTTNARAESVAAVGQYSLLDGNTLFAVGNGTSATDRVNAFEVNVKNGWTAKVNFMEANNGKFEFASSQDIAPAITTVNWAPWNWGSIVDYEWTPWFATTDVRGTAVNITANTGVVKPVTAGETIQWSFKARKKTGNETGKLQLNLLKCNSAGGSTSNNIVYDGTAASYTTEWVTYSGSFTVPSGMEYVRPRFSRTNTGVGSDGGYEIKEFTLIQQVDSGIILTSPNGTKYKLGVDDSGNLTTTAV